MEFISTTRTEGTEIDGDGIQLHGQHGGDGYRWRGMVTGGGDQRDGHRWVDDTEAYYHHAL